MIGCVILTVPGATQLADTKKLIQKLIQKIISTSNLSTEDDIKLLQYWDRNLNGQLKGIDVNQK